MPVPNDMGKKFDKFYELGQFSTRIDRMGVDVTWLGWEYIVGWWSDSRLFSGRVWVVLAGGWDARFEVRLGAIWGAGRAIRTQNPGLWQECLHRYS